jgi:hypothetical protein
MPMNNYLKVVGGTYGGRAGDCFPFNSASASSTKDAHEAAKERCDELKLKYSRARIVVFRSLPAFPLCPEVGYAPEGSSLEGLVLS